MVHLGYVGAGELAALYAGAELVALPSFYEGFGLPAIEALSAGAPLVASDLPVLREVAGDAALYAPPTGRTSGRSGWRALLADPACARSCGKRDGSGRGSSTGGGRRRRRRGRFGDGAGPPGH